MNWDTVFDGEVGQKYCPPGKKHAGGASLVILPGAVKADQVDVNTTAALALGFVKQQFPALMTSTSVDVSLVLYEGRVRKNIDRIGSLTADTLLERFTWTYQDLKSNTRHAVDLVAGNLNNVLFSTCFKTGLAPADMNTPFSDRGSSGCFAFVEDYSARSREKSIACLCGARNATNTEWARTDAADGFTYIKDADWRTDNGCSSS